MSKYFDKAFFRFLAGFIIILAVSFFGFYLVTLFAGNQMQSSSSQTCCTVQQYQPGVQK